MSASEKSVGFLGFGSYLPPQVRGNEYWNGRLKSRDDAQRTRDVLALERTERGEASKLPREIAEAMAEHEGDDLFRGARLRHVIADDAEVSDMEAEASRRAMRNARVSPHEIDLVIVNSMVPDRIMPSNGPALVAKCELVNASGWSLDVGCASFQPQLMTAAALIKSGMYRKILVVLSSAATRLLDYDTPMSTGFGDGATAAVVGEVPAGFGVRSSYVRTEGSLREGIVFAPVTEGQPQRRWDLCGGATRFASFDPASGKQSGVRAIEFCRDACNAALSEAALTVDDVALFVCTQSLGWFVSACRRAAGVPASKTIDTFPEIANIGAGAMLFNLQRAAETGRLRDGDNVLMYSQGAGLTRAAAVYRWHRATG